MNPERSLAAMTACLVFGLTYWTAAGAQAGEAVELLASKTSHAPSLDGRADDAAWQPAPAVEVVARGVMPKTRGTSSTVTLRAVYTDTHLYLLVQWTDAAKSDAGHKTWNWSADKKAYTEGTDREDALSVAFEHTGPFTGDMLSGDEGVWDVWHWKAFRTNPQGHAMDRTHRFFDAQPALKANKHTAKDGGDIWIARPEDAGDTVEKKQAAPSNHQGDRVPQYLPGVPTGSAADVTAKGAWAGGKWTLELARKLGTGNADDTAFDTSRAYRMAVGVHDDTGDMDKATEVVDLRFSPAASSAATVGFDDAKPGSLPAGWTGTKTGAGAPKWTVERDDTAPSRPSVLKQSGEATYPVAIKDDTSLADGFVEVKFKPISGREDQAAGVIWRAKDADNYYVCRANAIEDNVVLYKTENGKRSSLDIVGRKGGYGVEEKVASGQWHELRVDFAGHRFRVALDGKHLFDVEDDTFKGAGKVGLWTKADSVTLFDDFSYGGK